MNNYIKACCGTNDYRLDMQSIFHTKVGKGGAQEGLEITRRAVRDRRRKEEIGFYVAFNSLGHIATR